MSGYEVKLEDDAIHIRITHPLLLAVVKSMGIERAKELLADELREVFLSLLRKGDKKDDSATE